MRKKTPQQRRAKRFQKKVARRRKTSNSAERNFNSKKRAEDEDLDLEEEEEETKQQVENDNDDEEQGMVETIQHDNDEADAGSGNDDNDGEDEKLKGLDSIPEYIFKQHMQQADDSFLYEDFEEEGSNVNSKQNVLFSKQVANKKWKRYEPRAHEQNEGVLAFEEIELDDDEFKKFFKTSTATTKKNKKTKEISQIEDVKEEVDEESQAQQGKKKNKNKKKEKTSDKKEKPKQKKQQAEKRPREQDIDEASEPTGQSEQKQDDSSMDVDQQIKDIQTISMKGWKKYASLIHPTVMNNLKTLKFYTPTDIQTGSLDIIKQYGPKDVILAAETGSGKTLSFGIPIISALLKLIDEKPELKDVPRANRKMKALILSPTRELAVQITKHIKDIIQNSALSIACIVGGISEEKQRRLLSYRPDILVATPGRYWDIAQSGEVHLAELEELRFLVVDEADRMVADGYFPELRNIIKMISSFRKHYETVPPLQKYVASATMTLEENFRENGGKRLQQERNLITELRDILSLKSAKIIDLTPTQNIASTIEESMIQCSVDDKDLYLYYLLLLHPGKTIIFANSISAIRHIRDLMDILGIKVYQMHGEMQQGQRLKSLDNFRKNPKGILVATDVAARGIDVKDIQNVIHFQLPRSVETYVHRCGRSGRMRTEGFSIAIVSPDDKQFYKRVCIGTSKEDGLPVFPVDYSLIPALKQRINIARKIKSKKKKYAEKRLESGWFVEQAKQADIELDEFFFPDVAEDAEADMKKDHELRALQTQLKDLLSKRVAPKHLKSKSFLTADDVDQLTAAKADARSEFLSTKNEAANVKKKQKKVRKVF